MVRPVVRIKAGWTLVRIARSIAWSGSPAAASRKAARLAAVPSAGHQRRAAAGLVAGQPDAGVAVLRPGPGLRAVQHPDDGRPDRQPAGGAGGRREPTDGVPRPHPVPWLELRRHEVDRGSFRSCLPPGAGHQHGPAGALRYLNTTGNCPTGRMKVCALSTITAHGAGKARGAVSGPTCSSQGEGQTSLSARDLLEGVSVQLYSRGYWKSRCWWRERRVWAPSSGEASFAVRRRRG